MKKFVVKKSIALDCHTVLRLHDHLRDHALHAVVIRGAAGTDIVTETGSKEL